MTSQVINNAAAHANTAIDAEASKEGATVASVATAAKDLVSHVAKQGNAVYDEANTDRINAKLGFMAHLHAIVRTCGHHGWQIVAGVLGAGAVFGGVAAYIAHLHG